LDRSNRNIAGYIRQIPYGRSAILIKNPRPRGMRGDQAAIYPHAHVLDIKNSARKRTQILICKVIYPVDTIAEVGNVSGRIRLVQREGGCSRNPKIARRAHVNAVLNIITMKLAIRIASNHKLERGEGHGSGQQSNKAQQNSGLHAFILAWNLRKNKKISANF
jgi:hypothetical protein